MTLVTYTQEPLMREGEGSEKMGSKPLRHQSAVNRFSVIA